MNKILLETLLTFLSFLTVSTSTAEEVGARNSYAVVWTIDTHDDELYRHTIAEHSTRVLELWTVGLLRMSTLIIKIPIKKFIKVRLEKLFSL